MYTDWLLIRRLAWEIDRRMGGARVRDVARLPDGRIALALWRRGETSLLCIDVFAPTPLVTLEEGELPVAAEPGFVRATGAALRNKTLTGVRSRKFDRILRLDFGSRSRFGVEDAYSLVCELVPRFGNVILTKASEGEAGVPIVVAALKEFGPGENAVRTIEAGTPYEPPPARRTGSSRLVDDGRAAELAEADAGLPLHVYRDGAALVQAYVSELPQHEGLQHELGDSLLDLFDELRSAGERTREHDRLGKQRRTFERALRERERKIESELTSVQRKLLDASQRDALREEGDAIYASLHELSVTRREEAKERAAALFARYKKAANAVAHLERRQMDLRAQQNDLEALQWELERTPDDRFDDFEQALHHLDHGREPVRRKTAPGKKRKPLLYTTARGSRIYVGRTPVENAEITFRVARPGDLWFHVQNQPGAHVILQHDGKGAPPDDDIETAAALAALHSKAKNSPKVVVDYTQRKYVRKRPAAPPGLVFYTNPKSITVSPNAPP